MHKHSAQTNGFMIEVFDGTTHTETVILPSFCETLDWFTAEVESGNMDKSLCSELRNKIAKNSDFFSLGILTDTWHAVVGTDKQGFGVTFSVSTLHSII
jgi:hypothetical protein